MDAYNLRTVLARFESAVSNWDCSLEDAGLTIGDLCVAIRMIERELSTGVVPPSADDHPESKPALRRDLTNRAIVDSPHKRWGFYLRNGHLLNISLSQRINNSPYTWSPTWVHSIPKP